MKGAASVQFSIVIPSWNGRALLARYLPSVLAEAARGAAAGMTIEILVSDDGSTDGTRDWLARDFPPASSGVRCVASPVNRGFGPAVNAAASSASGSILLLLNNDAELLPGALAPLAGAIALPEVFAVTMRAESPAGDFATGGKLGRFRRGFWEAWRNFAAPAAPSFALVGGFCAVRREAFLALGGFDPIFAPYYWEDLDLSYRARKRGWTILYLPQAGVRHEVSASIRQHRPRWARAAIIHRNRLLFHWRNLDPQRLRRHCLWAVLLLPQLALKGDFAYHAGFCQALARWPAVRRFRRAERRHWRLPDAALAVVAPAECNSSASSGVSALQGAPPPDIKRQGDADAQDRATERAVSTGGEEA
ncbi:MAG: glycosyltransferase family 2 protein [Terriglobales bacterium]